MQDGRDRGRGCYCQLLQGSSDRDKAGSPVGFDVPPFLLWEKWLPVTKTEKTAAWGVVCNSLHRVYHWTMLLS